LQLSFGKNVPSFISCVLSALSVYLASTVQNSFGGENLEVVGEYDPDEMENSGKTLAWTALPWLVLGPHEALDLDQMN
jgi:hypothetical protein